MKHDYQKPNLLKRTLSIYHAVLIKNYKEYIRYPANAIFGLLMPLVWTLPTYLLIKSFLPGENSPGLKSWIGVTDFYGYFMIGALVSLLLASIFWNLGFSLKRLMDIGLLETTWACPISKLNYILAESCFALIKLIFESVVLLLLIKHLYRMAIPVTIIYALPWFIPFFVLMYGFGIGFASLVLLVKDANTLVDTSNFFISFLTGTQNPPQVFTGIVLFISMSLPITYFLDLVRTIALGTTPLIPVFWEKAILLASAAIIPLLAIAFFYHIDRKIRREGTLHVH